MKKSINFSRAIKICLLFLALQCSELTNAQITCNFPVVNSTTCIAAVSYTFYSATCQAVATGTFTVSPGNNTITCPVGAFDIDMEVIWLDNATCTIVAQSPNPIGANQGCSSSNTLATLTWSASNPACTCGSAPGNFSIVPTGANIY
jgi:hypothetical protein